MRTALVTGGAKRVGRAIVDRLVADGFDVVYTYHTTTDPVPGATGIRVDLTDPPAAVAEIGRRCDFDRLDVLVNNASLFLPGDLRQTDVDLIRRLSAIHVESPLLLCRHFEHPLRKASGHVINLCDLLAERPWPAYLAFCATKAALVNLTLGLARELAPDVTVNGIAPGVVEWPEHQTDDEKNQYLKRVPLARAGTPADVAGLVQYLVTAGRYVTGQIIRLDGGRSIT